VITRWMGEFFYHGSGRGLFDPLTSLS